MDKCCHTIVNSGFAPPTQQRFLNFQTNYAESWTGFDGNSVEQLSVWTKNAQKRLF